MKKWLNNDTITEDPEANNMSNISLRNQANDKKEGVYAKIPQYNKLKERVDKLLALNPREKEMEERVTIIQKVH